MARKRSPESRRRRRALADYQRTLDRSEDGPEQELDGDATDAPPPQRSRSARVLDATSQTLKTHRADSPRRQGNNLVVPLIAVAGLGLVILFGTRFLSSLPSDEPEQVREQVSINISWDHPRVQSVVEWIGAIHSANDFVLRRRSDFAALQNFLGIEPDKPFGSLNTMGRDDLEKRILAELRGGQNAELFRDFVPREARLEDASMHASASGTVFVQMPPREDSVYARHLAETGKRYRKNHDAQVRVSFTMSGADTLVTGWEVIHAPPKPRAKRTPHPSIAQPQARETEFGGKAITITESEPVPLDHLPDTPPELRREIDGLIATLTDLDAPGASANRSIARLKEIGRPAIPRLLTKMYETPLDSMEGRLALRGVIRALSDMTGQRFGFSVADSGEIGTGSTDGERKSALKQWYAWWYNNFDRDYTTGIDTDDGETLLLTEKEKATLSAEEREALEATVPTKR